MATCRPKTATLNFYQVEILHGFPDITHIKKITRTFADRFNVYSSNAKQVIVLKGAGIRTYGRMRRMTTIGIRQNLAEA